MRKNGEPRTRIILRMNESKRGNQTFQAYVAEQEELFSLLTLTARHLPALVTPFSWPIPSCRNLASTRNGELVGLWTDFTGRGVYNGRPAFKIEPDSIVNVYGGFK